MELSDVVSQGQFEEYYNERKLSNIQDKIEHLIIAMKIRAIRGEEETEEERLEGLEELVLLGYWNSW